MGSFDAAQQYIRRTTHAYAREMIPGVPVRVQFEDYPDGTLAETIPSYRIDGRGKFYDFLFIIKYDIDFVRSNQANITSEGVRGVIVHELAHAKQFMQDQTFTAYPHRNRKFRDAVTEHAATLNLRNPKLHALAVAKEDYRCYLHRYRDPKNEDLPPRWLLHFWVFACPNCGYSEGFVAPRGQRPYCTKCKHGNVITAHLPPSTAADFLKNVKYESKKNLPQSVITRIIIAYLKKYLRKDEDKKRLAQFERKYVK
jgi:predicted SprT family Zn-dependent metalloprotease